MPFARPSCGERVTTSRPSSVTEPLLRGSAPYSTFISSVRPAPISPATPRISLAQGKGHVIHPRAAEVVDLQAHRAGRLIEVGILVFQLTADHHLDKSVLIQRRDLALGDKLPVTKDRHVVANLEDLFHTVEI